jgi:methylase of polypeptide subunit release factors
MLKNILISKLFDIDLLDVALNKYSLSQTQRKELETKLRLLNSGTPLDYLIGRLSILGLDLIVNEHTLIPREETEFWLERYKYLTLQNKNKKHNSPLGGWQSKTDGVEKRGGYEVDKVFPNDAAQIGDTVVAVANSPILIDLGTGTGLIGIYLSDIYENVYLLDINPKTLEVAKQNIELNKKTNCQTLPSNGLERIEKLIVKSERWDLVANLPYLPIEDIFKAKEYKVEYEPAIALYSGNDGLELFNKVLGQIKARGNKPSNVVFELDPRNIQLAQKNLDKLNYKTEIWLDQNGLERVLVGKISS